MERKQEEKKAFCFDIFQIKWFKFSIKLLVFNFPFSHLFFGGGLRGEAYMSQNYCSWKELFQVKVNTLFNGIKNKWEIFFNTANFF